MKNYKAIFFDWDGTAVVSRSAPADDVIVLMDVLLHRGIKLCVISGTTYDKIAGGALAEAFSPPQRQNLFLGLARGAYNYGFNAAGQRVILGGVLPDAKTMALVHRVCFDVHEELFLRYGFNTDIVFDRPNYCKIDLLASVDRGDKLFFQADEAALLDSTLAEKGFCGGLTGLVALAEELGAKQGLKLVATTDAKYLEVGMSTKSDNVNFLMEKFSAECGISPEDCCFWGDEFLDIGGGIFGSDAYMLTKQTANGDFFDVSDAEGLRPKNVSHIGGGVDKFLSFLAQQGQSGK